mgnify:CR=1 FL=1
MIFQNLNFYQTIFIGLWIAFSHILFSQDITSLAGVNWSVRAIIDAQETPTGMLQNVSAIDLDTEGNLYIIDSGRNRLLKYSAAGIFMKEIGGFGRGTEQFNDPRDVDAHLTLNIFVTDFNNNRIVRFDSNLNYLNDFNPIFNSSFYFEMPLSVTVNNQYDIFILEDLNKRIVKIDRFNQPLTAFGTTSENLGQLLGPYQVTLGRRNILYVSDPLSCSIQIFDFLGNYIGNIIHPDFIEPKGIFTTAQGELLVADPKGQTIYFFNHHHTLDDILNLKILSIHPLDIALWNPGAERNRILYVVSSRLCVVLATE